MITNWVGIIIQGLITLAIVGGGWLISYGALRQSLVDQRNALEEHKRTLMEQKRNFDAALLAQKETFDKSLLTQKEDVSRQFVRIEEWQYEYKELSKELQKGQTAIALQVERILGVSETLAGIELSHKKKK